MLYSVMLQCKLAQGTSDAFVCDVKAALTRFVRFLTDPMHFSILTADTIRTIWVTMSHLPLTSIC